MSFLCGLTRKHNGIAPSLQPCRNTAARFNLVAMFCFLIRMSSKEEALSSASVHEKAKVLHANQRPALFTSPVCFIRAVTLFQIHHMQGREAR